MAAIDGADETPSGSRGTYVLGVLLVYVAAAALCAWFGMLFGFGVQALGASLGLWEGDPNSNDGEESWATLIGGVGCLGFLGVAGFAVYWIARAARRKPGPPIVVGTIATIGLVTAFGLWLFAPAG